ncbi:Atu1372/SO_1960 family protein, partial [Curtobacterium sp. CT11-45]|uniref:Atu1372/SO_1960 family protein n=1 Tax=Curtobacterium sp. CT11-45 TaxID=3243037 RepID=UPI0039B01FFC
MTVADRLAELGLTLPAVAAPVAAYVPAVVTGRYVYTAGQLPFVDGSLPVTGKVGGAVDAETATAQARVAALNALAAVESVAGSLDRVARVVKVTAVS